MKKKRNLFIISIMCLGCGLVACTDTLEGGDHFYTFKGEMMSDFLLNRAERYGDFTEVLKRADILELLSARGGYTCFAPNNQAMQQYLVERGKTTVGELTDLECDTLAYTHLVKAVYATADMSDGVLPMANMQKRYLQVSHGLDANGYSMVFINKTSAIVVKDDSVQNGVVHTLNRVLTPSTSALPDIMRQNPHIRLYNEALQRTGIADLLFDYEDRNYVDPDIMQSYSSNFTAETGYSPEQRLIGYTAFMVPDSILKEKHQVTDLQGLYRLACEIYDPVYTADAQQPYHSFDSLTHRKNPLNRFISYHLMNRTGYYNLIVPKMSVNTNYIDPQEFYKAMAPFSTLKFSYDKGLWINRDRSHNLRGSLVSENVEAEYEQFAINGVYYYVDDIVTYGKDTRDKVFNTRMRLDFSCLFPELMTNGLRGNGNTEDGMSNKGGRNYWFPEGYLADADFGSQSLVVYRFPHNDFECFQGDEMNCFGEYDFTFNLPPVPEGVYQVRIGYCALSGRGIAQFYFDDTPQGIPLDMRVPASDPSIGWVADSGDPDVDNAVDKAMFNRGFLKGPDGVQKVSSGSYVNFRTISRVFRRVIATGYMDEETVHKVRMRSVFDDGNAEFMLDYIELCPKSVYASEAGEDRH